MFKSDYQEEKNPNNIYYYFQATAVNFDSVLPKISHYKQKEVTPRAWNVPLSFGNVFNIKVTGYKKVFTSLF